eukprot:SAG11_NODE_13342_length_659_cov_1.014286_2_plen_49_part_01
MLTQPFLFKLQIQGYTPSLLRSRKTYSRYLKKFPRPKIRQYFLPPMMMI